MSIAFIKHIRMGCSSKLLLTAAGLGALYAVNNNLTFLVLQTIDPGMIQLEQLILA
jgi:hypothetical protein